MKSPIFSTAIRISAAVVLLVANSASAIVIYSDGFEGYTIIDNSGEYSITSSSGQDINSPGSVSNYISTGTGFGAGLYSEAVGSLFSVGATLPSPAAGSQAAFIATFASPVGFITKDNVVGATLTAGFSYSFSAALGARADRDGIGSVTFDLLASPDNGATLNSVYSFTYTTPVPSVGTFVSLPGNSSPAILGTDPLLGQELFIRITETSTSDDLQQVFIDNLELTAVPEPSSLALLALGFAGIASRRKPRV